MNLQKPHTGWTVRITTCRPPKLCLKQSDFSTLDSCAIRPLIKGLKAVFVQRQPNSELPYIHSLVRLANLSGIAAEMNESQLSLLDVLNPLNIEARYPLNKEKLLRSLTESRCEDLIRKAEELLTWIKTKC